MLAMKNITTNRRSSTRANRTAGLLVEKGFFAESLTRIAYSPDAPPFQKVGPKKWLLLGDRT